MVFYNHIDEICSWLINLEKNTGNYRYNIGGGSSVINSRVMDIQGNLLFDAGNLGQRAAVTTDSKYIALKDGQSVAVYDRNGQLLWKEQIANGFYGAAEDWRCRWFMQKIR
jgi:outer membrane protein assembly factor BamB